MAKITNPQRAANNSKAKSNYAGFRTRYENLFEESPLSLWEEDFSEVRKYFNDLRSQGVADFRNYFDNNPPEVERCASLIKVVNVNKSTLELYKAKSKEDLYKNLANVLCDESYPVLKEELIALAEGKTTFESEAVTKTLLGDKINTIIKINVVPGYEKSLSRVVAAISDITKSKRYDKILRESEHAFQAQIDTALDAIITINAQGTIVSWNNAAKKLLGYSPSEVLDQNVTMLIPQKYRQAHREGLAKFLATGKGAFIGKTVELQALKKDGSIFPIELSLSHWKNSKGTFFTGTIRDITERKKAEKIAAEVEAELRQKNERLEAVMNFTNCGMFLLDRETRVTYANKVAQDWFGPFEQLKGKFCWQVFNIEDPEKDCAGLKVVKTGKTVRSESFLRFADEGERYYFVDASPIKDLSGNVTQVIELVVDITNTKMIEDKLKVKTAELIRQNKITSDFLNILEVTASSMNFKDALNKLLPYINGLLESDCSFVYTLDSETHNFLPSHYLDLPKNDIPFFISSQLSKLESKQTLVNAKFITDLTSTVLPNLLVKFLRRLKARSAVVIPIIYEKVTSAILACAFFEEKSFGPHDVEIINKLQKHLEAFYASCARTSNLLNETMKLTEHIETIEAMSSIDRSVLAASTEEELIQSAITMMSKVIATDMTEILIFDEEDQIFKSAAISKNNRTYLSTRTFNKEQMKSWSSISFGTPAYYPNLLRESLIESYEKRFADKKIQSLLVIPLLSKGKLVGATAFGNKLAAFYSSEDLKDAQRISNQIAIALSNIKLISQIQDLMIGVINSITATLDAKSPWTQGHSQRVCETALKIGKTLKLNEKQLNELEIAALFHDIGKVGTHDAVLDKPEKLSKSEFDLIKEHPVKSGKILSHIPRFKNLAKIIRHHHERWDGTGYPEGLSGENIPLLSRILMIADAYDAMSSDRPYRKRLSLEDIILEFSKNSGSQFDPELADLFIDILFKEAREKIEKRHHLKAA